MTKGWTLERRLKQVENCRKTKPWQNATGPKTHSGKEAAKQNALKHGFDSAEALALRKALHQYRRMVDQIIKAHKQGQDRN